MSSSDYFVEDKNYFHSDEKVIIFMIGLPARGKSYIGLKLQIHLQWLFYKTKVFNVGSHRRQIVTGYTDAKFFDPHNSEKTDVRDKLALEVLEDIIKFLRSGGHIGIHDATNSTKKRRQLLVDRLSKENDIKVFWLESICTDEDLIKHNIKFKIHSPDYRNVDVKQALKDFETRLSMYERAYQPLDDQDYDKSYLQLYNVGSHIKTNNINGYIEAIIVRYLMNYNLTLRSRWLSRHGESVSHLQGHLGGDECLSPKGQIYAQALAKFFDIQKLCGIELWCSTLIRAKQTCKPLESKVSRFLHLHALNEISAGICEEMTYAEIKKSMPDQYEARQKDKLRYRYPGGESYLDLIARVTPLILELERKTESVFIVSHQGVLRTIIGYWTNCVPSELPHIEVPFHTVLHLTPSPYGCREERYCIDLDRFQRGDDVFWNSTEIFHRTDKSKSTSSKL